MSSTVDNLTLLIRLLASHSYRSPTTISRLVTGSGDTLRRLECKLPDGSAKHRISVDRVERAMTLLSTTWPMDLEWPRHIPRPTPKPKEAA